MSETNMNVTSSSSDLFVEQLVGCVPGGYEWMIHSAASSLAWSGAWRWLMAERNLQVAKNPETIKRNEAAQLHWAALVKSVEHMIPSDKQLDLVNVINQMLADRKMTPPEDIEAYLKQTAALNHTTVEEERAILKKAVNDGITDDVLIKMRPNVPAIANKLANDIASADERELDIYEVRRFAEKLGMYLYGDGKAGGNPGALERQRSQNRRAVLPAFAQRERGKVEALLFMGSELNDIAEAICAQMDEMEREGREVVEEPNKDSLH